MDGPVCKAIRRGFLPEKEDHVVVPNPCEGLLVERVQRGLFPVQTRTLATHGFPVCLLPQTMVVSSKSVEPIQVLQCSVQRVGAAVDDRWLGRRPRLEPSHLGGLFDRRGHRGQRMERKSPTYAKALIELRTYARGVPFDGLEGFLIKMQTLDDTIVDFTPPLPKRCIQAYRRQFVYEPLHAQCYVDGRPRPLMSAKYWTQQDKRTEGVDRPSIPTSKTWVEPEHDDDDENENEKVDLK